MLPKLFVLRSLISPVLIVSGLALCSSLLKADVIYSNFDSAYSYSDGSGVIVADGSKDYSVAEELTVFTNNYDLSSIEFVASSQSPDPSNTVSVSIYADNGGVPAATALETITLTGQLAPFNGSLSPVLTETSLTTPELYSGLSYWLVMDGAPSESLVWDLNSTGTSGYLETDGTAGNWVDSPNPYTSETNGVFEIDGSIVPTPEPQAWLLIAGGLALTFCLARRRQQRLA